MSRFIIVCIDYEEKDALLRDTKTTNNGVYTDQWFFQFNGDEPTLMDAYDYMTREYSMPEDFLDELAKECDDELEQSKLHSQAERPHRE